MACEVLACLTISGLQSNGRCQVTVERLGWADVGCSILVMADTLQIQTEAGLDGGSLFVANTWGLIKQI